MPGKHAARTQQEMHKMHATWTKLADGSWGVRVEVNLGPLLHALIGQEVEVTTKAGEKSMQKITRLVSHHAPRPAKRIRGPGGRYKNIPAIEKPLAIFEIEPREKISSGKTAARKAPKARQPRWNTVEYDILLEARSARYSSAAVAAELDAEERREQRKAQAVAAEWSVAEPETGRIEQASTWGEAQAAARELADCRDDLAGDVEWAC